jgi:hypothetical protein
LNAETSPIARQSWEMTLNPVTGLVTNNPHPTDFNGLTGSLRTADPSSRFDPPWAHMTTHQSMLEGLPWR